MRELPQQFIERLKEEFAADADALCTALDGQSPTSIRFNPFKITSAPSNLEPIGWSRYGFYLAERPSFTLDSAFHAGVYYVQEARSQFVGHILSFADVEGARVVDMCAAPGGKSTLYSTLVGLDGLVVANEINRQRASVLADNVRKWGLGNIVVSNNDTSHLAKFQAWADVVAVDAPCSGEGMFRKMEVAREEWSQGGVLQCVERQGEILRNSWRTLKAGGILIYSTCTFNRAENEGVIESFEEWTEGELSEFEEVECAAEWGVTCGRVGSFQTFRFMPHKTRGEGFFVAVARKGYDVGGRIRMPKGRKAIFSPLSRIDLAECARWVEQPERMSFYMIADTVYGYYIAQVDAIKRLAESLNVIYSGVAIGQIFKGKMSPDGALALFAGYNRDVVPVSQIGHDEMLSYLRRGEVSAASFEEGINLVVDESGYSVGFVKRIGARVNNRYINSLKILK